MTYPERVTANNIDKLRRLVSAVKCTPLYAWNARAPFQYPLLFISTCRSKPDSLIFPSSFPYPYNVCR